MNMKPKTISEFFLVVIISILFGCAKNKGEAIDLKLKCEVGHVERVYAATVTKGGPLAYQSIIEMRFTIDSVKTDRNVIDVKIVRISSETDSFGEKESYDSNKNINEMTEEEKSTHHGFQDVLNKSFSVSINNKGKVIEPFKSKEATKGKLTEEIIDISNIYIPFPDEPVYLDSEWKAEKTDSMTNIKTVSTYKITGISDKEIMISITSEMEGIKGFLDKNTAKGHYVLDKKTCKMISGDFSMLLEDNRKVFFKFRSIPDL
jgi:hypothetical protein